MHITQITLSNFRSFRHSSDTSSSSSSTHNALPQSFAGGALNCVIGRNGSGKSNLFDAVQFVLLAPRFVNLRPVRVGLLVAAGRLTLNDNGVVAVRYTIADTYCISFSLYERARFSNSHTGRTRRPPP
jgi:chromosome segregation ATPase